MLRAADASKKRIESSYRLISSRHPRRKMHLKRELKVEPLLHNPTKTVKLMHLKRELKA